ncbi:MAG: ABC transporter substrate-binding protein [Spirochaetaceae bacterium]
MKHAFPGIALVAAVGLVLAGCGGGEEVSQEDAERVREESRSAILDKTVEKHGGQGYAPGVVGGRWVSSINNDPKSFNTLNARDADTGTIAGVLYDYLADYDPHEREWKPNIASWEIEADEETDSMRVVFTLRDDLYWTTPGQSQEEGVPVTSDDVVYWYREIVGDPDLQQPGYSQQFVTLPDGSQERIHIEKIDDRRFAFVYPRIVANPVLSSNMFFGPRHVFEPAKEEDSVEDVLNLYSVDADVTTIPSMGEYHITEYSPGVRVVLERNPHYWKTDEEGTSYPYMEELVYRIVPDRNTEFLLFQDGTKDAYSARPEDLEELVDPEDPDYTVYNGGEELGAGFFTMNQNPENMDPVVQSWFAQTEFRQAMSSLLNRERIARQIYRGLAEPAHHFFAKANPFYDEDIRLEYTYDPERALELLESIGITRDDEGVMRDADGNAVEFDINMGAENNVGIDTANIFADELDRVGINARVRPIDFQQLVEKLRSTYDWEMALLGAWTWYWPSQGSNVWPSRGDFHLWHPLQNEPATEWEARIDELYNEGRFTIDEEERKEIYDEYQRLVLEQVPMLWTVHPLSFTAVRDKWDNVYYDTLNGLETTYVFLKDDYR